MCARACRACVSTHSAVLGELSLCRCMYSRCACTSEQKCYLRLGRPPRHVAVCAARERENGDVLPHCCIPCVSVSLCFFLPRLFFSRPRAPRQPSAARLFTRTRRRAIRSRKSENPMKISVCTPYVRAAIVNTLLHFRIRDSSLLPRSRV